MQQHVHQRLIWGGLEQSIFDEAIDQWRED